MTTSPRRLVTAERRDDDADASLRPQRLDEFIGQAQAAAANASRSAGEGAETAHLIRLGPKELAK